MVIASSQGYSNAWKQFEPASLRRMASPARAWNWIGAAVILSSLGIFECAAVAERPSGDAAAAAVDAHVAASRSAAIRECNEQNIQLPPEFLAWVDGDRDARRAIYGSWSDPLRSLLALRALEIDLGIGAVRGHSKQLALAFAVQAGQPRRRKASPWNDGDREGAVAVMPDVSARDPLVLRVPTWTPTESVRPPSERRSIHDEVIAFLDSLPEVEVEVHVDQWPPLEYDDKGIAKPRGGPTQEKKLVRRRPVGADVIASTKLQRAFNEWMAAHGHPGVQIDCGERVVFWLSTDAVNDDARRASIRAAHELFHDAYRATGRLPAQRDPPPTPSESMAWFIRNNAHEFGAQAASRGWPLFPLDAPWPLLLMLADDDQPLREREQVWAQFRETGVARFYGEYIGDIAQQFDMQSARRVCPFPFSYGSIQMMWKDGGVCGTMGNIGARTHRILGEPASTAGQPGHCALVVLRRDGTTGRYSWVGEQYATGGDEVTTVHSRWDMDGKGLMRKVAFHQSTAWGVSADREGWLDAMVLASAMRARSGRDADAATEVTTALLKAALDSSPYALAAVGHAIDAARDADAVRTVERDFAEQTKDRMPKADWDCMQSAVRVLAEERMQSLQTDDGRRLRARGSDQ